MSIKLMSHIWEHPGFQPGTPILEGDSVKIQDKKLRLMKFVLLALADNANDDGVCWPKVRTIAKKCNLSDTYCRGLIGALERNMWLEKKPRYTYTDDKTITQTSNEYTLNVKRICEGGDTGTSRGGVLAPVWGGASPQKGGDTGGSRVIEPSLEPSIESSIVPEPSVSGPLSEHQKMFQALCDICGWDYKVLGKAEKGQIAQTLGVLKKAGYSLGDLEQFVPRVWVNDWRYQRNRSHPTPTQVRTEIGKLRSEPLPEPPKQRTQYGAGVSLDSVDKVFDEMERLGISYGPQDTNQEALRQLPDSSATRDSRHLPRVPQRVRLAHADVNYQRSD